ncbi:MAG: hypothetical protein ACU841_11720 [Gammaproteobacteria bacterium]
MLYRKIKPSEFLLVSCILLSGCAGTRQIAVDHPRIQPQPFQTLPGFQGIDGDDYYIRLVSEFESKGGNILAGGCSEMAPSYERSDLSAALIYRIRNDDLKFKGDAAGFLYQATSGKCNFNFDAKKLYLTPWLRLDAGKKTMVDYNFYTNADSDVDVSALVGDVNAASGLLALTGVGAGVSLMGQVAGQWFVNTQQAQTPAKPSSAKHSSETHSLPALIGFAGKAGTLNQAIFSVYDVVESGISIFGPETRQIGELKIYPEISSALLLKISSEGIPDARDLSLEEMGHSSISTVSGGISLQQLIEQSTHPVKPDLKPDWSNYAAVENNCRNLKRVMKDLGFNKFDRNAMLYYFLNGSEDWKNYNVGRQKVVDEDIRPKTLKMYRSRGFGGCLAQDDYSVMKMMGLPVNSPQDWDQIDQSSEQKLQRFTPLKSIERQLLAVLKNAHANEMETQLYPLLTTAKSGDGTVLLQNHLGGFDLERLLNANGLPDAGTASRASTSSPQASRSDGNSLRKEDAASVTHDASDQAVPDAELPAGVEGAVPPDTGASPASSPVSAIPGQGVIVNARQLAQVFTGLMIDELSCSRPVPGQQDSRIGNSGILLFTTKSGSPRAKGGAMEYEFAGGKITRIAFQLPTFRDFEQDILDRPEVGGCRIEDSFLSRLH